MSRLAFLLPIVIFTQSLPGQEPQINNSGSLTLSLPDVISLALRQNLSLERAKVQIELRENDLQFEEADSQPNLTGSLGGSVRYAGDGRDPLWDTGEFSESLSGSLNSSLILYNGGGRQAAINQARSSLEASINEHNRSRQIVLFNSIFRYLEAILGLKEIEIQTEELASRNENLERIIVSYENQIRIEADVLRQRALVADSERRLAQARQAHQRSLYFLKELLLIPPETEILFDLGNSGWGNTDFLPEPDVQASWSRILQRPDLIAQQYRLEAVEESIRLARSGGKPAVSASASLRSGYSSLIPWGSVGRQFFENQPELAGGVSVTVPIFDRRRTSTDVARARLQQRQEEINMVDLKQAARTDLLQAALDFNTAKSQLLFSEEQLRSADAALQAEQARYDAGATTLLEVNSLRSTRLDAAIAVEESWFALFTNRLDITLQDGTIENFLIEQLDTQVPELQ